MLFDPEPKRSRKDFFNMDKALSEFINAVSTERFIVVTGLRRYGKTSLMLTGLNEAKVDYVFVDCRLLSSGVITLREFLRHIQRELRSRSWAKRALDRISQVDLYGVRLRLSFIQEILLDILDLMGNRVLVLDEAQELRRSNYRFDSLLAYMYDHTRVTIIVSGSQIGVLYKFLRLNDPAAPLYGRPYREIKVPRLTVEESRKFLELGFKEYGITPKREVIEEAIEAFDGIIGWLTFFGHTNATTGKSVKEVLDYASRLAAVEVMKALEVHGMAIPRYIEAMRVTAILGRARWSDILRGVTARLGRIPRNRFSSIIKDLVDMGLLEKTEDGYYIIPDPVVRHAVIHKIK